MKQVEKTAKYVREILEGECSGHDWFHIERVWINAKYIAEKEGSADSNVVELAALLHDLDDWKFNETQNNEPEKARSWLESIGVNGAAVEHICNIITNISFKGANVESKMTTVEGKIVQDADRLDALGAVGIARAFAYGGMKGRSMYDPDVRPTTHKNFQEYKDCRGTTINHFYEKLLLLRDRMNTKTGREMAKERHDFMEKYLEQFFRESKPDKKKNED